MSAQVSELLSISYDTSTTSAAATQGDEEAGEIFVLQEVLGSADSPGTDISSAPPSELPRNGENIFGAYNRFRKEVRALKRPMRIWEENGVEEQPNLLTDEDIFDYANHLFTLLRPRLRFMPPLEVCLDSSSVRAFQEAVLAYPASTKEEDLRLSQLYELGRETAGRIENYPANANQGLDAVIGIGSLAREELIRANLRSVVFKELRYEPSPRTADLIQAGMCGLVRAAEGYDWRHGAKFDSYAEMWIHGAIMDELSHQGRPLALPDYVALAIPKVKKAHEELSDQGKAVTIHSLAEKTGCSEAHVRLAIEASRSMKPLNEETEGAEGRRIVTEDDIGRATDRTMLQNLFDVAGLSKRQRELLVLMYAHQWRRAEIARMWGIDYSTAQRIHDSALAKLRSAPDKPPRKGAKANTIQEECSSVRGRHGYVGTHSEYFMPDGEPGDTTELHDPWVGEVEVVPAEDPPDLQRGLGTLALASEVKLKDKELHHLELASIGLTMQAAAAETGYSEATVKDYRQEVMQKLGARNMAHAILLGLKAGLLKPGKSELIAVRLNEREVSELQRASEGLTVEESAEQVGLSKNTIKDRRQNVIKKLKAVNMVHAIRIAFELGVLVSESRS